MKNNITLYLIIILVIVSLNFNECLTDNLRAKKSIKSLGKEEKLFGYKKNPREIYEYKKNLEDLETNNLNKISHGDTKQKNVLRQKRDREDRESLKRQAELEVTKTELAELQRKIENEIVSLKNRYKKSRVDKQDDDFKLGVNPRLVKIEVDTYEIDSPQQLDHHNQNIKKREDNTVTNDRINIKITNNNNKNKGSSRSIKRRMITYDDKRPVKSTEEDIEKKIEALKKSVREQIDLEKRSKETELKKSNSKYDEMKNISTNQCAYFNDVDKKVKKRSTLLERKNKSKKEPVVKKKKKSVSKNILIKNKDVDSNLITSKSKIKKSSREIRKTSHHDKSKHNKHLLHKNKYKNKHSKVVKKSVGNKNIKSKLSVNDLNREKNNKQALKRIKAHTKFVKEKNKLKHPHKRHYRRWDIVEREGRSVDVVENKNSNAEVQSDDGLDILNSQDNTPIASEYKEAFGGFPKDPADSLTRYKRIKRYKS